MLGFSAAGLQKRGDVGVCTTCRRRLRLHPRLVVGIRIGVRVNVRRGIAVVPPPGVIPVRWPGPERAPTPSPAGTPPTESPSPTPSPTPPPSTAPTPATTPAPAAAPAGIGESEVGTGDSCGCGEVRGGHCGSSCGVRASEGVELAIASGRVGVSTVRTSKRRACAG